MNDCTIIILGVTGDLATKRLMPALYDIIVHKKINKFLIVGVALEDTNTESILNNVQQNVKEYNQQAWHVLQEHFFYYRLDFSKAGDYKSFAVFLKKIKSEQAAPENCLVYCAIPPQFFLPVTENLSRVGIIEKKSNQAPWYRVVYEKPFGYDKKSAQKLNEQLSVYLDESQIFRIDHYLAKDIVGTLVLLRFTNRVLEPLWNKENIDWVEIVLSEDIGIEERGKYYDAYGALKDVVQNHMLQIVALIAMEVPTQLSGEFIRDEKARVLQKTKATQVLLGQYEGYTKEKDVPSHSKTETFAVVQLMIDNERWRGVPFYLKTGKYLEKKETIIYIQFKEVKCLLTEHCVGEPNYLTIRIMPDPGFALTLNVKEPGMLVRVTPIAMDFCYECTFSKVAVNSYEYLLREVMKGEPSVSVRFDEIEYAWDIIDAIETMKIPVLEYKKGSKGPEQLQEFARKNHMKFRS